MEPCQAPFPTPWNLPFHPAAGIQTSILISESLVGRIVARTRQCAGVAAPPRAPAAAATDSAAVIVVSGSLSVERLSQGAARAGVAVNASTANIAIGKACRVFMIGTSLLVPTMCSKQTFKSTVWVEFRNGEQISETGDTGDRSHGTIAVRPIEQERMDAGVLSRLKIVHKTVAGKKRALRWHGECSQRRLEYLRLWFREAHFAADCDSIEQGTDTQVVQHRVKARVEIRDDAE